MCYQATNKKVKNDEKENVDVKENVSGSQNHIEKKITYQ